MKKFLLFFLTSLVLAGGNLGAQSADTGGDPENSWQMPERIVEFGLDLGLGFGNNIVKLEDVFNFRKTVLRTYPGIRPGWTGIRFRQRITAQANSTSA
jgi:hypothetical protein